LPSYSATFSDLHATGPALEVAVGPSREFIKAVTPLGRQIALPRPVTAIIDTGAQSTVLKPELVARLELRPVGAIPISTPSTGSTPLVCDRYHVNLYFAKDFVVENVFAVEAPMGGVHYDCLIGRDVLRSAVLVYDGRANKFTLTF
jgi:predicted aspartyl protease